MMTRLSLEFRREDSSFGAADLPEKASNLLLRPWRLAKGKIVTVSHSHFYEAPRLSQLFYRVIAWLTTPFTLLGMRLATASRSHQALYGQYKRQTIRKLGHKIVCDAVKDLRLPVIKEYTMKALEMAVEASIDDVISEDRETIKASIIELCQQQLGWVEKYQDYFVEEFVQGRDGTHQMLGTGLCNAITYRLAAQMLEHPDSPIAEIHMGGVLPSDRFLQAAMHINFHLLLSKRPVPEEYLAKHKMKVRNLSGTEKVEAMRNVIMDHLLGPHPANKLLILGRATHATLMRFDTELERFAFFDPNFGLLAFTRKAKETDQDLAVRMSSCWFELYRSVYDPEGTSPLYVQLVASNR
jgi:hypothetical protein